MAQKMKKKKEVAVEAMPVAAESEPSKVTAQEAAFEALLAPTQERKLLKKKKKKKVAAEPAVEEDADAAPAPKKRKKAKVLDAAKEDEPAGDASQPEGDKEPAAKKRKKKRVAADADEAEDGQKTDPFKKKDPAAACQYKVCVSQLPWHVDEALLRKDFSDCGEITVCVLLTEKRDGYVNSRGIAFINFATEEGRAAALKYNGTEYGGRFIKVNVALEREDRLDWKTANGKGKGKGKDEGKSKGKEKGKGKGKPRAPLGPKPEHCTSIIIKSLSDKVVEDDLSAFFKDCGEAGPTNIRILQSAAAKGLAFVDFDDTDAVDQAIKLNGTDLKGDPAHLDYSKPRAHKISKTPAWE